MGNAPSQHEAANKQSEKEEKKQADVVSDYETKLAQENEKYRKALKEAEESMENDEGIPNVINNYAKLRTMSEPQLDVIGTFVDRMNEGWDNIMKQLPDVKKKGGVDGAREARNMRQIHNDYWSLLLKTSSKVGELMAQCELQRNNVQKLTKIIDDSYSKSGVMDEDNILAYKSRIEKLGKWIKPEVIQGLMNDWQNITQRLTDASDKWEQLAKSVAAYCAKETMNTMLKITAGTIAIVGVIGLLSGVIICVSAGGVAAGIGAMSTAASAAMSSGAAAFSGITGAATFSSAVSTAVSAAGTAVSAASTAVAATGVGTTGVIVATGATAVASASAVVVGAAAHGYFQVKAIEREKIKIQNSIHIIINKLDDMFRSGKNVESALNDFKDTQTKVKTGIDFYNDEKSYKLMKEGLEKITEYLDEYAKQGKKVMNDVKQARKDYLGNVSLK